MGRGRAAGTSPVVGTWQTTIVLFVAGDLQEWVTRWRFDKDRRCGFERTTFSFVEGIPRTVARSCTYRDLGTVVEVRYDRTGDIQQLPYRFPDFSNRRLILEGVEYERIG
jgi:hypothetical protein